MIYCDTSYLVRLYLKDTGFDAVRLLCSGNAVASGAHSQVELPTVLHGTYREGRIHAEALAALIARFETDRAGGAFHWQPLTPRLPGGMAAMYARLPVEIFLRAADALRLACAAVHGFAEVYSNDRRFLAAAPHFDLKGLNVITA